MTLSQNKLEDAIIDFLNPASANFPTTADQAADKWTDAYHSYALDATDASGDSLLTSNKIGFKSAITFPPAGAAATTAAMFGAAFMAYWTGATFAIGKTPPTGIGGTTIFLLEITSIVTVASPASLIASLTSIFLDAQPTNIQPNALPQEIKTAVDNAVTTKAKQIAAAFHTATTSSVIVLIVGIDTTPPPLSPQPITNTGTIL